MDMVLVADDNGQVESESEEEQVKDNSQLEIEKFKKREQIRVREFNQFCNIQPIVAKEFDEDEMDFKQWWLKRKPQKLREYENDLRELEMESRLVKEQQKVEKEQEALAFLDQLQQPIDQPIEENIGRIMTVEERKLKLQELLESIPYVKQELWDFDCDYSMIDDKIIEKVEKYSEKKLEQLLGQSDKQLATFICKNLRKGPDFIFKEIEGLLDEEAERFVMLVWRLVLFETEAKRLNLQ